MIDQAIQRWIRAEVRQQKAYHVPSSAGLIKLDAMESPYTWDESLVKDWLTQLSAVHLNRYPEADAYSLRARLREVFHVPNGLEILLGNGSDELIQILMMAVAKPGVSVLAPEPTFVMYRTIASWLGIEFIGVPLKEDFALDRDAMLAAIEQKDPALIFISYPNNPTGNLFDPQDIDAIIEKANGIVVIDEAYQAFANDSYLAKLQQATNVLLMRTVSKMGLAGLRLGYLVGAPQWIEEFNKIRLPYNINTLTQKSAEFALRHKAMFDAQAKSIVEERTRVMVALQEIGSLHVYPSQANFILFRARQGRATQIFEQLLAKGILIKNLSANGGKLADCLRVTIGTTEENNAFLKALTEIIKA
ncbi:MAG: histidinol-phosphate transaminase [Gammaproteobacteria bacterium]|nr:histidinol-phosphate transaminase [Gammaproteobacteria bacterium]MDH5693869.1 histidinol-phosphate transaminase [Gammaproteobacteria bacterium]